MTMCLAARVIHQFSTDSDCVLGVTSIDGELFVLLKRDDNQVAVYSINDYQLLRHLHLPGFTGLCASGITACAKHKCLYASDYFDRCIHRYDLSIKIGSVMKRITSRHISKWPVPGQPNGLSVIPGTCNLLVACHYPTSKLVELRADSGQLVREIALQSDIKSLHHAVQLTTGQYVICHGTCSTYRVCMVDIDGRVTHSYGGQRGSDVGQLNYPRHLAVAENSQFIAADRGNNRIVLLSPTLEFVRHISERVSGPERLYFHETTRRLFVGLWGGGVVVVLL